MPEGTALRCGRACTMAHGDTFALGHAVEADCGALTIGGAAHAHRGAAAQGESRRGVRAVVNREIRGATCSRQGRVELGRSEEHTSELQSLMRISYAVFCLKKKK